MMVHYSSNICLKNSACLIIVYSFQFLPSISWQVSEYFTWTLMQNFTITNGCPRLSNFQKLLMRKKTTIPTTTKKPHPTEQ